MAGPRALRLPFSRRLATLAISGTPEGVSEKELVDVIDDVAHCPAYFQLLVKALLLPGLLDLAHTAVPTHLVLCEKDRVFPPPVQPVLHHLSAPGNQNDHTRGPRHIPMFEAPAESPRSSPTSSRSTAHRSGRSALERLFQVVGDRAEELLAVLPRLFRPDEDGQVFGHLPAFDRGNHDVFQLLREVDDLGGVSSLPRCCSPRVQAKIEAIGLVEWACPAGTGDSGG
ncbi:putative alpha/beta hydrolase fold protein [Mycobacterium xenopi 3993]|nr:putative alpha/beta hydrolase fold protein [Mycobacterium xenopi 3993]